jgi:hypothetical protein
MFRRRSSSHKAKRAVAGRLPTTEEVRDQVAEVTDELGQALDVAKDAITKAISSAGRRGTEAGAEATRRTAELGKEAGRKGMAAGKRASRRASGAAREAVGRRLPEPEQVAEITRRAADMIFPERGKQYRKAARKRRRRLLYGGTGLAGLGMLIGWLTAPRRGDETRQVLKERANAASDKVAEMRASAGSRGQDGTPVPSGMDTASGLGGSGSMTGSGTGTGTAGPSGAGAGSGGQGEPTPQNADVTPIHQGDGATTSKRRDR